MKTSALLALGFLMVADLGFAGPMSGGGGKAIACFGEGGTLKSARLLDLFEGEAEFGDVRLDAADQTSDQLLAIAQSRLAHSGYMALIRDLPRLDDAVAHVRSTLRLLPMGVALEPIDDSFHDIAPAGCRIVQAAHFLDENNIVVDRALWESFSELDRAALTLHEAVYWLDRTLRDVQDSRRSRRTVSLALAADWRFEAVDAGLPQSYDLCQTMSDEPLTLFAVYERGGFQILQFLLLNGDAMLSKTTSSTWEFPFLDPIDVSVSEGWHGGVTAGLYEAGHKFDLSRDPILGASGLPEASSLSLVVQKSAYPAWIAPRAQLYCLTFSGR